MADPRSAEDPDSGQVGEVGTDAAPGIRRLLPTSGAPAAIARSWASSLFGFVAEGRRRRRPSDLVRVAAAIPLVVAITAWASRAGHLENTVYDLLVQLPGTGRGLFRTSSTFLLVAGIAIGILALLARRPRVAATMALGGVASGGLALVTAGISDVESARRSAGLVLTDGAVPTFPAVGLAVSTALILSAGPYLTRPARRVAATLVPLAGLGTIYLLQGLPSDVVGAIVIGWGAAGFAHLVFGSPAGTPSAGAVERDLASLGVETTDMTLDVLQSWGAVRFECRRPDGGRLAVRVIGRDATDARMMSNLWQSIWYRSGGSEWTSTRLQRVEREAFLLMLAERAGVRVPVVVTAGRAGPHDDAILAVELPDAAPASSWELWPELLEAVTTARAEATRAVLEGPDDLPMPEPVAVSEIDLGTLGAVPVAARVLDSMWATLAALHDAGLIHGDICPENILIEPGGEATLVDFSRSDLTTDAKARSLDHLGMLVATARVAGPLDAVAGARRALGSNGLVDLLSLLQPAALSAATRRRPGKPKLLVDALREEILRVTGADAPELTELRRVSPTDLLLAAATILGIYLLAGQLASVDDLWATLTSANGAWVVAVIFCSQVPQVANAVTVVGAVPGRLPFARVVMLQFANGFTGLVGGTAANTALIIRFFQRQGLAATVAVSSGLLWSVAGFISQVGLTIMCLLIARPELDQVRMGTGSGGTGTPWLLYLLVLGGLTGVLLAIPRIRRLVMSKTRPQVHEIRRNLRAVLSEPRRAGLLFGGAVSSQLFFALSLMSAVHAYGGTVSFPAVVLTNSFASLVGGMAPVPGGMGITEAGMIAGLTAAGVPQETALAATLLHRSFTYYLPPVWGWGALNWLRRNEAI